MQVETERVMEFVARSRAMRAAVQETDLAARVGASLLITGERGVGKAHLARYVHAAGAERRRPFLLFDCAGGNRGEVSAQQIASAFARGRGGTVFFKGVDRLGAIGQSALLSQLDANVRCRGTAPRTAPRVVCSAAPSLFEHVGKGAFSETLYYRLNVVFVSLPPLRHRPEDIEPLLRHFMRTVAARRGLDCPPLRKHWRSALVRHDWPGNLRELRRLADSLVAGGDQFALPVRAFRGLERHDEGA